METPGQEARSATAEALLRFLEELRLARATELAQSGRWLEAEALLTNRYERAGIWWTAAHQKDPANGNYPKCIEALEEYRKRQIWIQKGLMGTCLALTAILAVLICSVLWSRARAAKGVEKVKPSIRERGK
jgi:hypothetical protein